MYILNRQRAAPNVHTALKTSNYWSVVSRVLCAKVVGATSREGFIVEGETLENVVAVSVQYLMSSKGQ